MNEISVDEKKPFPLVGGHGSKEVMSCWRFGRQLRALWATSEYVSNQYVKNVGWCKKNRHLSKWLKFAVVVWAISSVECHWVEGSSRCTMWFLLQRGDELHNWFSWGNAREYKPPVALWINLGIILGRECGNVCGRLSSLECWD